MSVLCLLFPVNDGIPYGYKEFKNPQYGVEITFVDEIQVKLSGTVGTASDGFDVGRCIRRRASDV